MMSGGSEIAPAIIHVGERNLSLRLRLLKVILRRGKVVAALSLSNKGEPTSATWNAIFITEERQWAACCWTAFSKPLPRWATRRLDSGHR